MFWVRIRLGGREYLGVLDTGATISIVAKKTLPRGELKNIMPTAAIRMGDGHVVHSCGDCEVEVPMGSRSIAHRFYVMDTEAFDFILGTDFFVEHSRILSLTLQAGICHKFMYPLHVLIAIGSCIPMIMYRDQTLQCQIRTDRTLQADV